MIKKLLTAVPNAITLCNLISGCAATFMAFNPDVVYGSLTGLQWCWIFIGMAAFFDFCDGASARALHAYSEIGKQLDSLSDLVSFGVAPGMMMLNVMLGYSQHEWLCFAALLIPAMGAYRLAKFNVDTRQATSFRGLPIPANAIFWIGACGWITRYTYPGTGAMVVVIVLVSSLMVSDMPMFSLKFKNFDWHENFRRYVMIVATAAFVAVWGVSGLMWAILLYILISAVGSKRVA
ncbi:MAG: CDP-alcohol phosphatidyltransferase family protein [Bacteroides sp.]|nr:CDP-alcohol phosphatidyltransferase family protein [Bacteroides sp.]MCM1095390.1 CDP-alcohol phosphatidyltransferase family protein [Terasakiella sp.]